MRSALELEIGTQWSHQRLIAEAAANRLARQLPRRGSKTIRVRLAVGLYALADWLSAEVAEPRAATTSLKTA